MVTASLTPAYLDDLNARALNVQQDVETPARTAAERRGADMVELVPDSAFILHASRTNLRPKMAPLSQANICASARHIGDSLAPSPVDYCLNIMPLFHIHGLIAAVLSSLAAGAGVYCTLGFNALRFSQWIDEVEPT